MSEEPVKTPETVKDTSSLKEAEFVSLRDEIIKRIELASQIDSLTLVAAGTLYSLTSVSSLAPLVYPIIALFLAARWANHTAQIGHVGKYIRDRLEGGELAWEHYQLYNPRQGRWLLFLLGPFSAVGLYLGTQLIALGISVATFHAKPLEVFLLIVDIMAFLGTCAIFSGNAIVNQRWRAESKNNQ